jgi:integrase
VLNEARPYLRFILNSHANHNGERLVMLRVRVRKAGQKEKKIDLSTGVHVKPELWLADKQSLSTKVRSHSAYNERLRRYHLEILTFCEKALAAHVGRRTWATLSYKKGIPLEAISKSLGHASISQTEDYLR